MGNVSFIWILFYEGILSCIDCFNLVVLLEFFILYELVGVDFLGCMDSDQLCIYVEKLRIVEVFIGFMLNGDNMNDCLIVYGQEGIFVEMFWVYDCWGEFVFECSEFEVNFEVNGWDGNYCGKVFMFGVYIWQVIVIYLDGWEEVFEGQIILI